ncbi:MAG: helix-turn-helix domain-containing protein [Halobacteria archaeon]
MSEAGNNETGSAVRDLLSIAELLEHPETARIYTYIDQHGEKTVEQIIDELQIPQGSAYSFVSNLTEQNLLEEKNQERPYRYSANEIKLTLTKNNTEYTITPELIDAVSRRSQNQIIDLYIERYGIDGIATALEYAKKYVDGTTNHRLMSRDLEITSLEAEEILQELRKVVLQHKGE